MLEFFLSVFFVVATAVVYTEVLPAPGMLLDFWDKFLHKHIKKEWILKPLIDCVYCFGGQLALWSGFFIWNDYKLLTHFLFIVTVLFTIHIYKLIWN
jgi:hypothetical protein